MSEDGSFTGGINVVLTPNDSSSQSGTGGSGKPAFAQQKPFVKKQAYGNNRPSKY
jgi:hypothetical protein